MISVIISTYKRKKMLKRAIDSVINQTFEDWELIVVHDGPTDFKGLPKDKRIKYLQLKENFGNHSRPKNYGIKQAKGEYIAFLDDDNEYRPDHLQALYSAIKRTGVDLTYGDRWLVDDDGVIESHIGGGQDFNPYLLLERNYIDTSDVLVKREVLEYVGGFDERYKKYLDWNLFARMVKAGYKFLRVPNILTNYHIHKGMMSHQTLDSKGKMIPLWSPHDVEIQLPYLGKEVKQPKVAIFSITYDRLDYTKKCFDSMKEKSGYEYDHFIVDNGSTDGTKKWLEKNNSKFKHIRYNPENMGISISSNQAIDEIVKGDYDIIMKVDNDCLFITKNWLKTMVKIWQSNHMLALSLYVQGLRDNPGGASRIAHGMINGELVGITNHIGGICCFVDAKAYTNFRWDESSTLHGIQDLEFSRFLSKNGFGMGYLENHYCEHYEGTSGQEKRYKEYFERRKKEKTTRYERNYQQIQERESAFSRNTPWGERIVDTIERYKEYFTGKTLDVGCGDGVALDMLSNMGIECQGIDLSETKIEIARKNGHNAVVGRMEQLPFKDNEFDVVLCSHTLEHAENLSHAVRELSRVGKRLIIIVPQEEKTNNPAHINTFSGAMDVAKLFKGEILHTEILNRLEKEIVFIIDTK